MLYNFKEPEEYEKFINQYTTGAFSTFDMEVLIPEVKKLKPGQTYLEVGVDRGKSLITAFMAARENVNVVGVDIADTGERQEAFRLLGLENYVVFIQGESTRVAKCWGTPINCLFIDADHSYDGCQSDINAWAKFVPKGGVILLHDGDESSPGVVQAIAEFVNTHRKIVKEHIIHKTPEKNTSMVTIRF